ncbi:MAG TPA: nucleotidyl transferase AbiEii/AbiGii toxin family protein [Kofleriaceae bacterium]
MHAALAAFARVAQREHIRWYVFGAQAVNLHGFPRLTADLDLTVDLAELSPQRFVAALGKAGFQMRFTDDGFIAATRVIPVTFDGYQVDLVLAGTGIEQAFLDEVVIKRLGSVRVPVISREHLVVTKILASRPKDLEDVRELLAMRELDHEKVEGVLAVIEEALDDSTLRATYRRLRAKLRR